jgi:hypothetical protein
MINHQNARLSEDEVLGRMRWVSISFENFIVWEWLPMYHHRGLMLGWQRDYFEDLILDSE